MKYTYLSIASLVGILTLASCNNEVKTSQTEANQQQHSSAATQHTEANQAEAAPLQAQEPVAYIPEFTFYKVKSGISFTKSDIPAGKNTVFLLFDPSCSHCQHEAADLSKNYDKLKNVNIYFVSMNDPALMVKFFSTFGPNLEGKENVELLYDKGQDFIQKFHIPKKFPANYVYGADGQLKAYWDGEKDIKEAIEAFTK